MPKKFQNHLTFGKVPQNLQKSGEEGVRPVLEETRIKAAFLFRSSLIWTHIYCVTAVLLKCIKCKMCKFYRVCNLLYLLREQPFHWSKPMSLTGYLKTLKINKYFYSIFNFYTRFTNLLLYQNQESFWDSYNN